MDCLSVWKSTGQTPRAEPQTESRGTLSAFVGGGNNGLIIPGTLFFRGRSASRGKPAELKAALLASQLRG
jgi:hypothetical protein